MTEKMVDEIVEAIRSGKWLTKEQRMQLHSVQEDYIEIFHTRTELREDNPQLWHTIVDQWEEIKFRLSEDEHSKCMSTATHTLDDIMGDDVDNENKKDYTQSGSIR